MVRLAAVSATAVLAACLTGNLAGCRIERPADATAVAGSPGASGAAAAGSFDAKARVVAMWGSRALPVLDERAGDFITVRKALADPAGAALLARHGHRERGEGAPWNMVVRLRGRVIGGDAESTTVTLDLDADGDGKTDAQLQLGPMLRGTALRDALPFVSFSDYTNQIEFAQLASALNEHAVVGALQGEAPASAVRWRGRLVRVLAVFTANDSDEFPNLLPVAIEPESAP